MGEAYVGGFFGSASIGIEATGRLTAAAPTQTDNELIFSVSNQQYSLLHSQNGITDDQVGGGNSTMSASTKYGNQFWCFLTDNRLRCGRWLQREDTNDFVDINQPNARFNDTHNCPAVGIDRDGYVHLMGGFHNDAMYYYVSNDPIASSRDYAFPTTEAGWTLQNINGLDPANANAQGKTDNGLWVGYEDSDSSTVVSYVAFTYDNNMQLYISMRATATGEAQRHGGRAYFMSKYDEAAGWQPIGDFNADGSSKNTLYTSPTDPIAAPVVGGQTKVRAPCVIWTPMGQKCWAESPGAPNSPDGYQAWGESSRPFIDKDGVIHVANKVHRGWEDEGTNPGSNASSAIYARSEDGGLTWLDAAGNSLTANSRYGSSPIVLQRQHFESCTQALGNVPANYATDPDYAILAEATGSLTRRRIRVNAAGYNSAGEPVLKWRLADTNGGNATVELATFRTATQQWDIQNLGWTYSEQQLMIDENFVFNISRTNTIRYSTDDGATWQTMTGGTSSPYNRNDVRYFKMTGKIRDTHATTAGNKITDAQVRFVEYTTPAWTPYSDSQGVNNVRPVLAGGAQITGNVGGALTSASEDGSPITLGANHTTFSGGTLNLQANGSYTYTPPVTAVARGVTDIIQLVFA